MLRPGSLCLLLGVVAFGTACAAGAPTTTTPVPQPESELQVATPGVATPPPGTAPLDRKMPESTPSGMREESARVKELKSALRNSKSVEERRAAQRALDEFTAGFPGRWEGKEVPAPEALMYAVILNDCRQYLDAVAQARRWLAVAPDDNINWTNAHSLLISCLARAGEFDAAQAELKAASETVYRNRDADRQGVEETIAVAMYRAGKLEMAARHFEVLATTGIGDVESGIYAVDCWLRLGKPDEATRIAARAADFITEGKGGERMKQLKAQVALVGKPAPGFAAAKWWKGSGGPVTDDAFQGKVTVVFNWNMQKQWNMWFFKRMHVLLQGFEGRPVQLVGVSRLAKFDPTKMVTRAEMTDDEELAFYDLWAEHYGVTYPLAVGGVQDNGLIDAWAGHVVPCIVVVGKDGVVTYVRTGKEDEHFAILKEMVEQALAR